MRRKNRASHEIEDSEYQHYIDSLKTVIKRTEESKDKLQHLQISASNQKDSLRDCLNNLSHLEEIRKQEQQQWQIRAQQLANRKKELELQAEHYSRALAFSNAELEHSLRMINLFPSSSSKDYLNKAHQNASISESLKKDWANVGDQLALSLFELTKLQEK